LVVRKKLRSYLEKTKQGYWQALNIDLCLYAVGDTWNEAISKLEIITKEYIDEAYGLDYKYCHQLMNRKAPLVERLRYFWFWFKNSFGLLNHEKQAVFVGEIEFTVDIENELE
jgi:hypothetical protein